MNYKDQLKLLSVQLKDYRDRLYHEETMRRKVFIELEKYPKRHFISTLIGWNKTTLKWRGKETH